MLLPNARVTAMNSSQNNFGSGIIDAKFWIASFQEAQTWLTTRALSRQSKNPNASKRTLLGTAAM
jgi:hypothetical protein